jgi:outer membrane protein OmpA-like peptidoglycan-associated protein
MNMGFVRAVKFAAMIVAGLSLAACANNPNQMQGANAGLAGSAAPGSAQDFVVNVGDRVFFESDQTELTPQSIAILDKQAEWLQRYNRYSFTIEGHADRHARVQHRARCASCAVRPRLPRVARYPGEPHAHDLLRQGASGRGV